MELRRHASASRCPAPRSTSPSCAVPTGASPTPTPPRPGTGGQAHGELTAINHHQFLFLERDGPETRPRRASRRCSSSTSAPRRRRQGPAGRPDGGARSGQGRRDGDYFRFPFVTIESIHPVDEQTILVACDNNYPLSNGRSRSVTNERTGPLHPDDNEIILIRLGTSARRRQALALTTPLNPPPAMTWRRSHPWTAPPCVPALKAYRPAANTAGVSCPTGSVVERSIGGHLRQQSLPSLAEPKSAAVAGRDEPLRKERRHRWRRIVRRSGDAASIARWDRRRPDVHEGPCNCETVSERHRCDRSSSNHLAAAGTCS